MDSRMVYRDHDPFQTLMIHGVAPTTSGYHSESCYHVMPTLKTGGLLLLDKVFQKLTSNPTL